jgi:DDE superfamily endonuclease
MQALTFICSGLIIAASLNCPGSWHDSEVARPIYKKLRDKTPAGFYLVADTAFLRGARFLEGRIRAPLKAGERLPSDPHEREQRLRFDRQLLSYRQSVEWGMRALQGSFGRLRVPMDINDSQGRSDILEICTRLHNLRVRCVGINQILNVYVPTWQTEDGELWAGFETMLFRDIRRQDRVSRFHGIATT